MSPKRKKPDRSEDARRRAAAALAAERRRRMMLAGGVSLGVVALIGILIVIAVTTGSKKHTPTATSFGPAAASVVTPLTSVPATALDAVGLGTTTSGGTKKLTAAPLSADGKPRVLYVGADFCPYCAFERWGLIVALSRFGTFSGLNYMQSSPTDVYPSTHTFSFTGSTYTSDFVVFSPNEIQDRNQKTIATLDTADKQLFTSLGGSSFPFLDIGGKWVQATSGTTAALDAVHAKTWQEIADALKDPTNPVAKAVLGTANQLTAEICTTTNNTPAAVCSSAGVQAAAKALPTS